MTIQDQIRAAIQRELDAGFSVNAIAIAAGVSQPGLSKFMDADSGKQLRGDTIDRLCKLFGMRLTAASRFRGP